MNFLVGLIIIAILAGASYKIYLEKKSGVKCIGCPQSKTCSKNNHKVHLDE